VVEDPQAEVGPVDGDRGAGDEVYLGIVEGFLLGSGRLDVRVASSELLDFFVVGVVDPAELGAGFQQAVAHAVDVAVVEADGGEDEVARLADRLGGGGGRCVAGAVAVVAHVVISLLLNSPTDAVFWWNLGAARSRPSLLRKGSSEGSGSVTVWAVIAAW
jgi:hypothetical protein